MGRTVTTVLVDAAGEVLGALPPLRLDQPHWPETADLVAAVRARDGLDIEVLRLLHADRPAPPGGHLTVLAQTRTPLATGVAPADVDLSPDPRVRVGPCGRVILDWGDAVVGHPAYDILRLVEGLAPADAEPMLTDWARRWRECVPGSAPRRALTLLRPVVELRAAATYAGFLANIEESEWPYHRLDVPHRLAAAVAAARDTAEAGIP